MSEPLPYEQLRNALSGLRAYDEGIVDSGIHDEQLRARCIAQLQAEPVRPYQLFPDVLARIARDLFLTDEAIADGYGLEDAVTFTRWLGEYMDLAEI